MICEVLLLFYHLAWRGLTMKSVCRSRPFSMHSRSVPLNILLGRYGGTNDMISWVCVGRGSDPFFWFIFFSFSYDFSFATIAYTFVPFDITRGWYALISTTTFLIFNCCKSFCIPIWFEYAYVFRWCTAKK